MLTEKELGLFSRYMQVLFQANYEVFVINKQIQTTDTETVQCSTSHSERSSATGCVVGKSVERHVATC